MMYRLLLWLCVLFLTLSGEHLMFVSETNARDTPKAKAQATIPAGLRKSPGGNPRVVEIVSDRLGQTEFRIADEIASAVASAQETGPNGEVALRVTPVVSRGGIQAVRDVLTQPNVDFGIVPARILDRLQETGELGNIRDRLTYVAPLYVEEVHLLAGPSIRSLADLHGQAVSIGEDEGTTQVLAREILTSAGIQVRAERLDLQDSVAALKAGEIAAAFLVSGKPVDGLKTLTPSDDLHLVPITLASRPAGFQSSTITADDYPQLVRPEERIDTLGVLSVLFAYNWPAKSQRGQLGDMFIKSMVWRLATLQKPPRHPKWQEVNLAGTLPGWRRLAAMDTLLKAAALHQGNQSLRVEFDQFLKQEGPRSNTGDSEALFQRFLRWRENPSSTGSR